MHSHYVLRYSEVWCGGCDALDKEIIIKKGLGNYRICEMNQTNNHNSDDAGDYCHQGEYSVLNVYFLITLSSEALQIHVKIFMEHFIQVYYVI